MSIGTLLEMARSGFGKRITIGTRANGMTVDALAAAADDGAAALRAHGARTLVFVGVNSPVWPVLLFSGAVGGVPVVPLNYRLAGAQLARLVEQLDRPLVVADRRYLEGLASAGVQAVEAGRWLQEAASAAQGPAVEPPDEDDPAVILFTSGTTAAPKGVVLRHSHLMSYVLQTVEFGSAGDEDAALVSVPPYHVAGVGTVLTNIYSGRRLVYLADFAPDAWLELVRRERVTQAMMVPTMLARVVDHLGEAPAATPTLRSLAYGGAAMPRPLLEHALRSFPDTEFVNSYGLTETSSTIAILGPEEHRTSIDSDDPAVRERLGSVGRVVPGIEIRICDGSGTELPAGDVGELFVRGGQVSGEYLGHERGVDADGWFSTRDQARIDEDGYLFVLGRADDTIIRGGENIAPAEIETALREHPSVKDVGVVGVPDEEWGERILAVVVPVPGAGLGPKEIRDWARARLRSSRTPDDVVLSDALPYNPLGKLLRRELVTYSARTDQDSRSARA